jgi:ParB family chromosome partitioning protein
LLGLPAAQQIMTAQEISAKKLSVRQAERLVSRHLQQQDRDPGATGKARPTRTRDVVRLEERLSDVLTASVEIRMPRRGLQGEIAIRFGSLDELDNLLHKLGAGEA